MRRMSVPAAAAVVVLLGAAVTVGVTVDWLTEIERVQVRDQAESAPWATERRVGALALPGVHDDKRRPLASRAVSGRGPQRRTASKLRIVPRAAAVEAPAAPAASAMATAETSPMNGELLAVRRHANGYTAVVIRGDDGLFTARRWPPVEPYVTGLGSQRVARRQADEIAHPGCTGRACGRWRSA